MLAAVVAAREGRQWQRPALAADDFPWELIGAVPRFVGMESTSCVAALQPNMFHDSGAEEFERFCSAAAARRETALIVSMIGRAEPDDLRRNVFNPFDASVSLPGSRGSIAGRRLPAGAAAELAPDLGGADRDLALRLRNRPEGAPWWAMKLEASHWESGSGVEIHEPGGVLQPLLVNQLGETLAGVWVPDGPDWRWYVVPGATDWRLIVEWLIQQAVREYVPDAMRRVRAAELVDDPLLTSQELEARDALNDFERHVVAQRQNLKDGLDSARAAADTIRFGLLYGTGQPLVDAVRAVLERGGFAVVDLDELLGKGASADLLASMAGSHWLVEVKAAGGNVAENLLGDLDRHLQTWSALGRPETLTGGVLAVNHQSNVRPLERTSQPYSRDAFVASLRYPVIPTLALFAWWRDGNVSAIVDAVTGEPHCHAVDLANRFMPAGLVSTTGTGVAHEDLRPTRLRWRRRSRKTG